MLPQIVIFEGIDGVGKSTQIKLLKSYYFKNHGMFKYAETKSFSNLPGVSNEDWQRHVYSYYYNFLHKLIFVESRYSKEIPIFVDRSHIGELVYGRLYRGLDDNTCDSLINMNKLFERCKSQIKFILYVDYNRAIEYEDGLSVNAYNRKASDEQNIFIQSFEEIKKRFPNLNMSIIDVTNKSIEQVHNLTIEKIGIVE